MLKMRGIYYISMAEVIPRTEIKSAITICLIQKRTDILGDIYCQHVYKQPDADEMIGMIADYTPNMKNWDIPQLSDIAAFLVCSPYVTEYKYVADLIADKIRFRAGVK